MRDRNLLFGIRWGVDRYDAQRLCGGCSSGLRGVAMRKFTVEFYANSEYSVRERLQEIDNSISNIVWPCTWINGSEGTKAKKHQVALKKNQNTNYLIMSTKKKILIGGVVSLKIALVSGKCKLYLMKNTLSFRRVQIYE